MSGRAGQQRIFRERMRRKPRSPRRDSVGRRLAIRIARMSNKRAAVSGAAEGARGRAARSLTDRRDAADNAVSALPTQRLPQAWVRLLRTGIGATKTRGLRLPGDERGWSACRFGARMLSGLVPRQAKAARAGFGRRISLPASLCLKNSRAGDTLRFGAPGGRGPLVIRKRPSFQIAVVLS